MFDNLILDIPAIVNFISDNGDKDSISQISEIYNAEDENNNLILTSKEITESKGGQSDSTMTIKYDLMKTFILHLMDIEQSEGMSYGDRLILNSMFAQGFVKEVK